MLFRRSLAWLVLLGGLLGTFVCLAGIAGVWTVGNRLDRTNDMVFERIDRSLSTVRDQVRTAQRRTHELKITTDDIGQSLKKWTQHEAAQRLALRLGIEDKAERLGLGLQQADHCLELAETTVASVQQIIDLACSAGAPLDAASVEPLHEQMASLRGRLQHATETVEEIRNGTARLVADEPLAERLAQVAQLVVRVVATLTEIDDRLGRAADQLSTAQTNAQRLKSKTHFWIVLGQVIAVLVIAWFAAGQVALCALGWKGCRPRISKEITVGSSGER